MATTTLLHYELLTKLGEGGMGVVYRAHDKKLNRDVALKVLPAIRQLDPKQLARFRREAELVAALNHPNIVTVYSVDEADGERFITMELVEGKTLADLIPKNGMPLERLLRLGIQMAEGLAAAHDRNVIHRDLKPTNIMVTPDERVKVLDFGLAKLQPQEPIPVGPEATTLEQKVSGSDLTASRAFLGTVPYMSPEQLEGRPVDHRADIFAFGVILYEMVVGKRPFRGQSSTAIITAILRDAPEVVSDVRDAPRQLGRLVRFCLEKDPERRFQSAKDLRNALEDLQREVESGEASQRRTGVANAARRAPRKRLRWMLAAALALLAGLVGMSSLDLWLPALREGPRFAMSEEARELLDQGRLSVQRGDTRENLETAERRFRRALSLEPGNPVIQAHLASVLVLLQRDFPDAQRPPEIERLANQALESADLALAHVALGSMLLLAGESEAAESEARRAKQASPDEYPGYTLLGEALLSQDKVDQGIVELRKGASLGGVDMRPRLTLARRLMQLGRNEAAAEEYLKILDYDPDLVNALVNLGIIYSRQGRAVDAIPLQTRAFEVAPSDLTATNLAMAYYRAGRMEEAFEEFREAHDQAPTKAVPMYNLGDMYWEKGDVEEAAHWFDRALEAFSKEIEAGGDRAELTVRRSLILVKLERYSEAAGDLEAALQLDPANTTLMFQAAQVYALAGAEERLFNMVARLVESGHPRDHFLNDESFKDYREDVDFLDLLDRRPRS